MTREQLAAMFVNGLTTLIAQQFVATFHEIDENVALRLLDDEFVELVVEKLETEMTSQVQRIHEHFGA